MGSEMCIRDSSLSRSLSLSVSRDVFELPAMWGLGYFMFCLVWVNDSGVFVRRCILLFSTSLSDVLSSVVIRPPSLSLSSLSLS